MLLNKCIRYRSHCQQWQVEDCVIQECTALKVFSSTCSTGLIWTLEEKQTNKGTTSGVMWALLQHLTPVCWGPRLQPSFKGRAVSEHNLEPSQVHCKDTRDVLQSLGRVIFMLSVRRDAFLSELLCHSHQVSGVWVAKTVRRNEKAITASVWAQAVIIPSSQGRQLIAFPWQELDLHLSVLTGPFLSCHTS